EGLLSRQRGVARILPAKLGARVVELGEGAVEVLLGGLSLLRGVVAAEHLKLQAGLGREAPFGVAQALLERRLRSPSEAGAGLFEQGQQRPRVSPLAGLQGLPVVARRGRAPVKLHQGLDIELVDLSL